MKSWNCASEMNQFLLLTISFFYLLRQMNLSKLLLLYALTLNDSRRAPTVITLCVTELVCSYTDDFNKIHIFHLSPRFQYVCFINIIQTLHSAPNKRSKLVSQGQPLFQMHPHCWWYDLSPTWTLSDILHQHRCGLPYFNEFQNVFLKF